MKSYIFQLERVLEWKESKEKNASQKFAMLQNELQYQKSALNKLLTEHENMKIGGLKLKNINQLRQQNLYNQTLEEQIKRQNELIHNISGRLEEVRLELVAAQKDRKVMEKLKEKDFEIYKENIKALEQKELDEIGALKYNTSLEGR